MAGLRVRAFEIPEVLLDWTLLRHALENAIANAHKYGCAGGETELAVEYCEPRLRIVVTNAADEQRQASLIARHGTDVSRLLHRRGDAEGIQSTNLGGQALRDCARILHGSVSLQLGPRTTRLLLEVEAPRPVEVQVSQAQLVYFVDDEPTMRMVYEMWVKPPSPLRPESRIFPPSSGDPSEMDASMRAFAAEVLAATPRPTAVVLDQNLRSQVSRRENATTGTAIAEALRAAGYKGAIIIRSANVSSKVTQQYLAAGADAVMSKDESRDSFLRRLAEVNASGSPPFTSPQDPHFASIPLLAEAGEAMWASLGEATQRDGIFAEFRQGARSTLAELLALLEADDVGGLPDELHYLLGQCRTVGAWRMQQAVDSCKASFDYAKLATLNTLLAQTFEAMDERSGGAPHAATALQAAQAEAMAELAKQKQPSSSDRRVQCSKYI